MILAIISNIIRIRIFYSMNSSKFRIMTSIVFTDFILKYKLKILIHLFSNKLVQTN